LKGWVVPYHDGAVVIVGIGFAVDGGKGAEFEIGEVGEDRGATGGDAVLDKEAGELGEEVVDLDGGLEVEGFVAERSASTSLASRRLAWRKQRAEFSETGKWQRRPVRVR
jgi:hypothetical protein